MGTVRSKETIDMGKNGVKREIPRLTQSRIGLKEKC